MKGWTKEELVEEYGKVSSEGLFDRLAYDLRNRLGVIRGYSSLLQDDLLNPERFNVNTASDYLNKILESSEAIYAIIDAGLDCKNKPKL